jgi:hypothetical protein
MRVLAPPACALRDDRDVDRRASRRVHQDCAEPGLRAALAKISIDRNDLDGCVAKAVQQNLHARPTRLAW